MDLKEAEWRNLIKCLAQDIHDGYRRLDELKMSRQVDEASRKMLDEKKKSVLHAEYRVRIAKASVDKMEASYKDLEARTRDLRNQIIQRTLEIRTLQRDGLTVQLAHLNGKELNAQEAQTLAEYTENVPQWLAQVEEMNAEVPLLQAKAEEESALLVPARENLAALSQLLEIAQSELSQLEDTLVAPPSSSDGSNIPAELRASIESKISSYVEAERELAKIVYLKKTAKVTATGSQWLKVLKSYSTDDGHPAIV